MLLLLDKLSGHMDTIQEQKIEFKDAVSDQLYVSILLLFATAQLITQCTTHLWLCVIIHKTLTKMKITFYDNNDHERFKLTTVTS